MSTREIVIIYKTKNVSPLLGKGALARHVLGENRFMPAQRPPSPPPPQKKGLEGPFRVIVCQIIIIITRRIF